MNDDEGVMPHGSSAELHDGSGAAHPMNAGSEADAAADRLRYALEHATGADRCIVVTAADGRALLDDRERLEGLIVDAGTYLVERDAARDEAARLREALEKAADTLADIGKTARLLRHGTMADACYYAADASRAALAPSTSPPQAQS